MGMFGVDTVSPHRGVTPLRTRPAATQTVEWDNEFISIRQVETT